MDERERNVVKRRIKEAHFPKVKTLEEFDFETASHIPSSRLRKLAEGEYVGRTEPVIFLVHQNRGPFLWPVLWNPAHRRELLQQGWNDVGKVFLIATILDVVYQLIVLRGVYILELLITAVTLAIVHYVLHRGPLSRIARVVFAARPSVKQRSIR